MPEFDPRSGKSLFQLALGLTFSLAILLGPHVAMLVYLPDVSFGILFTYWALMVTYLMAAYVINVTPDTSNLGIGGTRIDNPFSFEDDQNRAMLKLALFLWPGKVVWWTLGRSWQAIRGA